MECSKARAWDTQGLAKAGPPWEGFLARLMPPTLLAAWKGLCFQRSSRVLFGWPRGAKQ